jgi:hypothetical protein
MRFAALAIAAAVTAGVASGCGGGGGASQDEKDKAVAAAKFVYAGEAGSLDLSKGPCLAETLPGGLSDWAADIAHDPRQAVDDQPANQCSSYRQGQTHHFVELTPEGSLIRAQ